MRRHLPPLAAAVLLSIHLSAAPLLRNPLPVPVDPSFASVHTADFNGDGWNDLLVVYGAENFTVLLANGDPFSAPRVTPMNVPAGTPAIGDVNRDGLNDLVVAEMQKDEATVMLGNGDGTFRSGATFPTIDVPGPLVLADFNGDDRLDLAVGTRDAHNDDNGLGVHLGDGTGAFAPAKLTVTGEDYASLTAVDLNRDGYDDLIAHSLSHRVFLGNGDGTFRETIPPLLSGEVAVGDFNRDQFPDLAISGRLDHDPYVEVLFGDGTGAFPSSAKYSAGYGGGDIAAVDVDDDGDLDLLATSSAGATVALLRGNPDGTFDEAELWLTGSGSYLAVSDFDRDGREDFLTYDYYRGHALGLVRGTADGFDTYRAFRTSRGIMPAYSNAQPHGGKTADVNGDGYPDVVLSQHEPDRRESSLVVMLNDRRGGLGAPILTKTGDDASPGRVEFAVADLNGDRELDVLTMVSERPAKVFAGRGDGTFAPPIDLPFSYSWSATPHLGHFDGDGKLDLFVARVPDLAIVRPGNGDGTFGNEIRTGGRAHNVFFGDLNSDGKLDFVSSDIRSVIAYVNDGTGAFTPFAVTPEELEVLALGDFTGDGRPDLLLRSYVGTELRPGIGNGTFGEKIEFLMSPVPNYFGDDLMGPVVTADFDGDTRLDFAVGTAIYLGNGDGTFRSREFFRTRSVEASAVADMDRNGTLDLVVTNTAADNVGVLLTRRLDVTPKAATLTLTKDKESPGFIEPVTFTATVTGHSNVRTTGTVALEADGKLVALIAVDTEGKASLDWRFPIGAHEVKATYTGDEYYTAPAATESVTVVRGRTELSIAGFPNPARAGRSVRISVSAIAAMSRPNGTVILREGSTILGEVTLGNRSYLDVANLSIGTHVITAEFAGNENFEPATASYTQEILKPVPEPMLIETVPGWDALIAGEDVQIRVSFPHVPGNVTGTVSLYRDDLLLAANVPIVNGVAQHQTTFTAGYHVIRAEYHGDPTWDPLQESTSIDVHAGRWGTPIALDAVSNSGFVSLRWTRIHGATSYTIWRRSFGSGAWEEFETVSGQQSSTGFHLSGVWIFAITAKDAEGNVSPMSASDAVLAGPWND